jgi:putative aminopeptidase FrvX
MIDITPYRQTLFQNAEELLKIDSPTGFTQEAAVYLLQKAEKLGYPCEKNQKGCVMVTIPGRDPSKTVLISGHIDTLGLMVRSITEDGMLKFTLLGGPVVPTLDGEYCRIHTRSGNVYTGTILSLSPSAHVYTDSKTRERAPAEMAVRLDMPVCKKEDVEKLGIRAGDFICIDPKTQITESGFLKSRFIDDKGGSACMLTLAEILSKENRKPAFTTILFFSVYEEVGHGAACLPLEVSEMLAVDMGCVGDDLSCTEYDVSICAKDSSGPYDYEMVGRLISLAEQNHLKFAVDIYPQYGSDVSAALRGGNNIRGALIGPGVHASHGMERTHWKGLSNTLSLLLAYVDV